MKVSAAYLCIDCDEIHDSQEECPRCLSRSVYPLTKWFFPLNTFAETVSDPRESRRLLKERIQQWLAKITLSDLMAGGQIDEKEIGNLSCKEKRKDSICDSYTDDIASYFYNDRFKQRRGTFSAGQQVAAIQDHRKESSRYETCTINNSRGEPMEFRCCLPPRRSWLNASYAKVCRMVNGIFKRGFVLSGEEHHSRVPDIEVLSAHKS